MTTISNARRIARKIADDTQRPYAIWRAGEKYFVLPDGTPRPQSERVEIVRPLRGPAHAKH